MDIAFRDATEADLYLVENDYLSGLRRSRDAGLVHYSRWYEVMRPEAQRLLGPPTRVLVAHNPELGPETRADVYGWLAYRRGGPPVVVWVHVKSHWRGRGFARALFEQAGFDPFRDRFDFLARSEMLFERTEADRPPLIRRMPGARWDWRLARKDPDATQAPAGPERERRPARARRAGEAGDDAPPDRRGGE